MEGPTRDFLFRRFDSIPIPGNHAKFEFPTARSNRQVIGNIADGPASARIDSSGAVAIGLGQGCGERWPADRGIG